MKQIVWLRNYIEDKSGGLPAFTSKVLGLTSCVLTIVFAASRWLFTTDHPVFLPWGLMLLVGGLYLFFLPWMLTGRKTPLVKPDETGWVWNTLMVVLSLAPLVVIEWEIYTRWEGGIIG